MICPECSAELDDAWTLRESSGQKRWCDGKGHIRHSHLTGDRAARIGVVGGVSVKRKRRDDASRLASAVLAVAQAPEDQEARADAVRQLVSALSEIAVSGKSAASVSAISALASRAGELLSAAPKLQKPAPGQPCPLCGLSGTPINISVDPKLAAHWLEPDRVIPCGDDPDD